MILKLLRVGKSTVIKTADHLNALCDTELFPASEMYVRWECEFVFEYSPAPGVLFEVLNSEHQALEQKAS